jgi:tRNA G10  N-methylase Trm11
VIDPITAVAAATKSYPMVKALVEAGREAHDVMSQVGVWYGHASDVLYADNKAKKVNPFKKLVFAKSVEAEALKAFAAKKKIEAQRKEIIELINLAYGAQGLEEYRDLRKQVLKERQEMVYAQQEMRETILSGILICIMVAIVVALVLFIASG